MKIETSYWSAIPVDYDELVKFAEEATDEIEKLDKACSEWAEVSQSNYQRAKKAEEEVEKLRKALDIYERERDRFRHAKPEITGEYFLAGGYGERDANQLPQYVRICPAYGVAWEQVYEKTDRTVTYEGS
jgi:hypothetical protein